MESLKRFLLLDLADFENLGVPFPIGLVLTGVILAIIIATFVINYRKLYTTHLLRQLIRHGATSEECAKTLSELRASSFAIRHALMRGGKLTYIVKMQGAEDQTYEEYVAKAKEKGYREERIDFSTARFYIPEDKLELAEKTLEHPTDGWLSPIIISVALVIFWFVAFKYTEVLLNLINGSSK